MNDAVRLAIALGSAKSSYYSTTLQRMDRIRKMFGASESEEQEARLIEEFRLTSRLMDYAAYVCDAGALLAYSLAPDKAPDLYEYKDPFRTAMVLMKIEAVEKRLLKGSLNLDSVFLTNVASLIGELSGLSSEQVVATNVLRLHRVVLELLHQATDDQERSTWGEKDGVAPPSRAEEL